MGDFLRFGQAKTNGVEKQPISNIILNNGLRRWLSHHNVDEVFASKFRSLKEYTSQQPLQFEIDFFRTTDYKTMYYKRIILNTCKSEFDTCYQKVDNDRNENLILYWLNDILNKRLRPMVGNSKY